MHRDVDGPRQGEGAIGVRTGQVAELAEDDVRGDAGEKPEHHRERDEPGVAAEAKESCSCHRDARHDREEEQRCGPVFDGDARDR
jgi:hypothetical protein